MSTKTYRGSCHCGAVRYQVELDLSAGTSKCNCSICSKTRNWGISVKPEAFRLLAGEDALSDYQFSKQSSIHHPFCKHCGVRTHGWGNIPEFMGPFVSVKLATLDDVPAEELASAPVQYCDGRANSWWQPPAEVRHL